MGALWLAVLVAVLATTLVSCGEEQAPFRVFETCHPDTGSCAGATDCYALCLCEEGEPASCAEQCGVEEPFDPKSADDGWDPDFADFEDRVLELTNERRERGGCCGDEGCFSPTGPLAFDERLRRSARLHARNMAEQDFFSHDDLDGRTPFDRIRASGYRGCAMGENIAAGHETPEKAVENWMASPGHCANILSADFGYLGVGYDYAHRSIYGHFWVQNFGG
jgi:uncharacterized protein YkwD